MRGISTLAATAAAFAALTTATASAAPDLSPLACVWENLPPAEQERLAEGFRVDLSDGNFKLIFATPNLASAAEPMKQCQLALNAQQAEALGHGLARHAAVGKAKQGIADRGEEPESVALALAKMNEGKREAIGDTLSCPGPHAMVGDWDSSVMKAVRKARLGFQNGSAYSWVSLAMYATMAEEGAVRRMNGKAGACG